MQAQFAEIVNVALIVQDLMNTVKVVINVPIVWAWDFVMSVNFVETVQPCVPMRIAHFAKGVQIRFVITAGNVHFVPLIFFALICGVCRPGSSFKGLYLP